MLLIIKTSGCLLDTFRGDTILVMLISIIIIVIMRLLVTVILLIIIRKDPEQPLYVSDNCPRRLAWR